MSTAIDEDIVPNIRYVIFRKCTPAWEIPRHELDACNLTYVVQGESRYTINNKSVDLGPGSMMFLPPHTIRRGITFPDRLMHCFSVDFELLNLKGENASLPFPIHSQPGRQEDIIHMFHELSFYSLNKQPGSMIKCRGLLLQILHRFLELVINKGVSNSGDSRITKAIRYMTTQYSERITIKMISKMAGLNPTYFGSLFRQEMGIGFNRYLMQIRVKNAENMLASGEYKISDIADACGFADVSHFYKQFKEIKGFPPSHSLPKKF